MRREPHGCQGSDERTPHRRTGARIRRAVALAALAAMTGCAASDTSRGAVSDTLPNGTVERCTRPPDDVIGSEGAAALSAAFPEVVQTLLSTASVPQKVGAARSVARTPALVTLLGYRLCLEHRKGVIPGPSWESWLQDVRPALLRRAGAPP